MPAQSDLLRVSHIDSDHIAGILGLAEEFIEDEQENAKPFVKVSKAWHNRFADSLIKDMSSSAVTVCEQSLQVTDLYGSEFEFDAILNLDPKPKACLRYPGKNGTYVEVFK